MTDIATDRRDAVEALIFHALVSNLRLRDETASART